MAICAWMMYGLVMAWLTRTTIFLRRRSGEFYGEVDTMAMIQIFLSETAGHFFPVA